nr:hypothetical protein [Anaerolineae bacterium]
MQAPEEYDFIRYLEAKQVVEDRAINQHVWQSLRKALFSSHAIGQVRLLYIGAGIGSMVRRILAWGLIPGEAVITMVDPRADIIVEAQKCLPKWAQSHGYNVQQANGEFAFSRGHQQIMVRMEALDLSDFIMREQEKHKWDLLLSHALPETGDHLPGIPLLASLVEPGGLFYFTLNGEGIIKLSAIDGQEPDTGIEAQYTGKWCRKPDPADEGANRLPVCSAYQLLAKAGVKFLDVGGSSRVIFPGPYGYTVDEAYALHYLIHQIGLEVKDLPGMDAQILEGWSARRHTQIEEGKLVYISHHIDFLGQQTKTTDPPDGSITN